MFEGTDVNITSEGRRYLGSVLGTDRFAKKFAEQQVETWVAHVERLAKIALTEPHAAYAAFRHSLAGCWTYLGRTTADVGSLFGPLEEAIRLKLIPALTGQEAPGDQVRHLLGLPTQLGGLGLPNPARAEAASYNMSIQVTAPFVALIVEHSKNSLLSALLETSSARAAMRRRCREEINRMASEIRDRLPDRLQRCTDLAKEKGASSWLEAIPIREQGFYLSRTEFRNAVALRFGWRLENLPSHLCMRSRL